MKFRFKRSYLSIPYVVFLALFIIVPIVLIIVYAFTNSSGQFSFSAAKNFFSDVSNLHVILVSLFMALEATILCLLIGFPIAYFLAHKKYNHNGVLVMLFIMPMWINFVLRTTATKDILYAIGINGGDLPYLATLIGMVYNYLPFVILPLYTTLIKLDYSQLDASADLGANPAQVFIHNVIPQAMPGIISAISMTFVPVMSSYVISDALSEGNITLVGNFIYLNFANNLWNDGSFMALILLILVGFSMAFSKNSDDATKGGALW